jgi:hypothetical protein
MKKRSSGTLGDARMAVTVALLAVSLAACLSTQDAPGLAGGPIVAGVSTAVLVAGTATAPPVGEIAPPR